MQGEIGILIPNKRIRIFEPSSFTQLFKRLPFLSHCHFYHAALDFI